MLKKNPHSASTAGWQTYTNRQHRYRLLYPPDWSIHEESPASTVVISADKQAQLAIHISPTDCLAAGSMPRPQGASNFHRVGELQQRLAQREVSASEFVDTISFAREMHMAVPAEANCYELQARLERTASGEQASILETVLSTFEFLP